jgi:hypothetical protein
MTIDTIKDVLGRIISINKNLTAESLHNLLTASGWDMHDIEEGLKVFKDFNYAGEKPIAEPAPVIQKPPDVTPKIMVDTGEMSKIDVSKDISQSSQNQIPKAQQIDNSMVQRPAQTVSVQPLPVRPAPAPSSMPTPIYQSTPLYQSPPMKTVENSPPTIITERSGDTKEWGIISLDIILFLIVLGLLLYILIR